MLLESERIFQTYFCPTSESENGIIPRNSHISFEDIFGMNDNEEYSIEQ
jgi:hypothetical protein